MQPILTPFNYKENCSIVFMNKPLRIRFEIPNLVILERRAKLIRRQPRPVARRRR